MINPVLNVFKTQNKRGFYWFYTNFILYPNNYEITIYFILDADSC